MKGIGACHTPRTMPSCTSPGSLLTLPEASFPARRPHSMRAFSSVAMSTALKGTLFARRMVSRRDVAVTMCMDPAVSEVNIQRAGSVEKVVEDDDAMLGGGGDVEMLLMLAGIRSWNFFLGEMGQARSTAPCGLARGGVLGCGGRNETWRGFRRMQWARAKKGAVRSFVSGGGGGVPLPKPQYVLSLPKARNHSDL